MHINKGANCKKLLQFGEITNFWLTVLSYIRSLSANLRFSGVVFFKFSWWPKYWEATWQLLKELSKIALWRFFYLSYYEVLKNDSVAYVREQIQFSKKRFLQLQFGD